MFTEAQKTARRNTFLKLRLMESGYTMNALGHTYFCLICNSNIGSGAVGHFSLRHKQQFNEIKDAGRTAIHHRHR